MKMDKLFNLLVMGGALLSTNSVLAGQSLAAAASEEQKEPAPAFCKPVDASKPPEENTCVKTEDGKQVVKEGFFCCWNTSCEES